VRVCAVYFMEMSVYTAPDDRMTDEWTEKDLEESSRDLMIKVLSQNLLEAVWNTTG
jgi:hypothetical protein